MSLTWYLVASALIFSIGAGGVLVRRNPLVILLCIELMLNGANLALVAVGLGLIVAIYRRKLPIDVDELRELQG